MDDDRGVLAWGLADLGPCAPGDPAKVSPYLRSWSLSAEGGIALTSSKIPLSSYGLRSWTQSS